MRLPYETPKITVAGSVRDLTTANLIGHHLDHFTIVTIDLFGNEIDILGNS
jgi:hypothetical protein